MAAAMKKSKVIELLTFYRNIAPTKPLYIATGNFPLYSAVMICFIQVSMGKLSSW